MNGYEFEDYIASLFRKMNFKVTQTPYSNDGGIDLIAEYNETIFQGKYLIQCKHWNEMIGQPAVRDLYGLVIANGANKGILITISGFTEQAYEFAKGKNIELIDGNLLKKIEQTLSPQNTQNIDDKNKYQSIPNFNYDEFIYLKEKIEKDYKLQYQVELVFKTP